jgi:hypothetical protein
MKCCCKHHPERLTPLVLIAALAFVVQNGLNSLRGVLTGRDGMQNPPAQGKTHQRRAEPNQSKTRLV